MRTDKFFVFVLCLLFAAAAPAQEGALLTGTITGTQKDMLVLRIMPPFSTNASNGAVQYTIPVDKKGHFSFRSPYKKASVMLYESNDEGPGMLVYIDHDTVQVQWNESAMQSSFSITQNSGALNRVSVTFQQMFQHAYDSLLNVKDNEPDFGKMVRAVNSLNEKGFAFLKQQRHGLDSIAYHQLAYDFYYRNLGLLILAPNYSPLYKDPVAGVFPFIVCYDYKYDQYYKTARHDVETMTVSPPQPAHYMDSVKELYAIAHARWRYPSTFRIVDENILTLSYAYRSFLHTYIYLLAEPFYGWPYPYVDDQTLFNFDSYSLWIHSIIQQRKVADWFLASSWILSASGDRAKADSAGFAKVYDRLTDGDIKQWLTECYAALSLIRPGMKAPVFTLNDEHNKAVSLSQFLGKPVFITFWSTGCGPCINELKTYNKQVVEKLGGDAAFINIAIDTDNKLWKEMLRKEGFIGINLRADQGWADSVVTHYQITAIPCHMLIDKNGILQSYNSITLYDLAMDPALIKTGPR